MLQGYKVFFVNITMNHERTTSHAGSVLAPFSDPKEISPNLNSDVYNNENDLHKMVFTVLKTTFKKISHVKLYTGTIRNLTQNYF